MIALCVCCTNGIVLFSNRECLFGTRLCCLVLVGVFLVLDGVCCTQGMCLVLVVNLDLVTGHHP